MIRFLLSIFILVINLTALSQNNSKHYQEIDKLLSSQNSMGPFYAQRILDNELKNDKSNAEYWIRVALIAQRNSFYSKADEAYQKAIQLDSTNSDIFFQRARMHIDSRFDAVAAMKEIKKAIAVEDKPVYHYYKGIYHQMQGEISESLVEYENALNNGVTEFGIFRNYGIQLFESGKYIQANTVVEKGLSASPNSSELHSLKGNISLAMIDLEGTKSSFTKAISLGYKGSNLQLINAFLSDPSYGRIGELLAQMGNSESAGQAFQKSIDNNEPYKSKYTNLGYCHFINGEFEKAEKCYMEAEKQNENTDRLYLNWVVLLSDQDKHEKAIEINQRWIKLKPNNVDAYVDMSDPYIALGKYDEAEKVLKKALEIKPNYFRAYGYLSRTYLNSERTNEALEYAIKAIEQKSDYAFGHLQKGKAQLILEVGDFCSTFKHAEKLGSKDASQLIFEYCK